MLLNDIINEVIDSKIMQKYLCDNIEILSPWMIRDMVAHSPVTLTKKYEIFNKLNKVYNESDYEETFKFIKSSLKALHTYQDGRIYEIYYVYRTDDGEIDESESKLFLTYDKAFEYIKWLAYENDINKSWTILTIWDKKDLDLYKSYSYCYVGTEVLFSCEDTKMDVWMNTDVNLPVPFKIGDEIITDGYPFSAESEAIIIEIGDNWDCCSVVIGLADGTKGPLKHGFAFKWNIANSISPLYRIMKKNN